MLPIFPLPKFWGNIYTAKNRWFCATIDNKLFEDLTRVASGAASVFASLGKHLGEGLKDQMDENFPVALLLLPMRMLIVCKVLSQIACRTGMHEKTH